MKIAVVSDIHGNILALEAVMADFRHEAPDLIVNLGDCVSGALWPEETADILRETNWPTIRGNHDRFLIEDPIEKMGQTDVHAAQRISETNIDWLKTTKASIIVEKDILLCHGTPDNDNRFLSERNDCAKGHLPDEATLLAELKGEKAPIICCGHSHIPREIQLPSTSQTILNPGSVGFPTYDPEHPDFAKTPNGNPHAQYALITKQTDGWAFQMKNIAYDWDAASAEAEKNGNTMWAKALKYGYLSPLS